MGRIFSSGSNAERYRLQRELDHLEPRIRRRLRGKFGAHLRAGYDLDDVLASTRRRLDEACTRGAIRAGSVEALNVYAYQTATRIALDALRKERREKAFYNAGIRWNTLWSDADQQDRNEFLSRMLTNLDYTERELLQLWLRGLPERHIADSLNLSHEAYRSRRRRLWKLLRTITPDLGL